MNSKVAKLALTAAFGLAITFTFNACDEKKKQDGIDAKATEAASEGGGAIEPKVAEVVKGSFTDTRDNKTYKTVKIGEQVWMAENLNYAAEGSKCGGTELKFGKGEGEEWYILENKNTANCDKYGRLYNWATAVKACPSGWHLPSNANWNVLMKLVDPNCYDNINCAGDAGTKLKAKSGWGDNGGKSGNGTDDYGFSALPGGYGSTNGHFQEVGYRGYWWSADGSDADASQAYDWNMNYSDEYASKEYYSKKSSYSVRCIKD